VTREEAVSEGHHVRNSASGHGAPSPGQPAHKRPRDAEQVGDRGRYFTLQQAADAYPAFTGRLLRRLVQQRRIAFSRVGRNIVLAEADIEAYVEANRVEPPRRSPRWDLAS